VIEIRTDAGDTTDETTEDAAKESVAAEHRLTITTYEAGGADDQPAAETRLVIGSDKQVSETQVKTAGDEVLQAAHQALVREARAAGQAYLAAHDSESDEK
jgi:hypothetical protein